MAKNENQNRKRFRKMPYGNALTDYKGTSVGGRHDTILFENLTFQRRAVLAAISTVKRV